MARNQEINRYSIAINLTPYSLHFMGAETTWISVILAPTWTQVEGFSYFLPIKIQPTYLSI